MDYQIRPVQATDAFSLLTLFRRLSLEEPNMASDIRDHMNYNATLLRASIESNAEYLLVALDHTVEDPETDAVVGFLTAHGPKNSVSYGRIEMQVGVLKSHQGRGIGTALIDELFKAADSWGVWRIELRVLTENQAAQALYERLGFVAEGRLHADLLVEGTFHDQLLMARINREAGLSGLAAQDDKPRAFGEVA